MMMIMMMIMMTDGADDDDERQGDQQSPLPRSILVVIPNVLSPLLSRDESSFLGRQAQVQLANLLSSMDVMMETGTSGMSTVNHEEDNLNFERFFSSEAAWWSMRPGQSMRVRKTQKP